MLRQGKCDQMNSHGYYYRMRGIQNHSQYYAKYVVWGPRHWEEPPKTINDYQGQYARHDEKCLDRNLKMSMFGKVSHRKPANSVSIGI